MTTAEALSARSIARHGDRAGHVPRRRRDRLRALGSFIGRDLSGGVALALSLGGLGLLIVQAVGGERFHFGGFAIGWLLAVALVVGLGLGPALAHYASADPPAITQAAGATALIVAAMGAGGLAFGNDLMAWYRPLTFALLGVILVSLVLVVFGSGGSVFVSLAIGGVWALLLLVDFNYVRHHATGDDVVFLSTGIFASVVNIFLSLLNLFSSD